jgi:Tol biopolymer transport system component
MSRTGVLVPIICLLAVVACSPGTAASPTTAPATAGAAVSPPSDASSMAPSPSTEAETPAASPGLPRITDGDPRIAYTTHRQDEGGGVYLMRLDGTDVVQLATDVRGNLKHPDWSPDGAHVVFVDEATEKMWIANLDGSPTTSIRVCDTIGCDYPAWSPDGTKLAFSRYESKEGVTGPSAVGIYVLDLASGEVSTVVRLERPLLADVPRWSPDGARIVFGVDRMDDQANETGSAIAVVPAIGGDPHYLTEFEQFAYYPDWNRATDEIVFSTESIMFKEAPGPGDDTWNLYTVKPDGSGLRQVTKVPVGQRLWNPTWTPDGTRITAGLEDTRVGVFVDPETGAVEPLPYVPSDSKFTDKLGRPRVRPTP